jgi:hypothetical protein
VQRFTLFRRGRPLLRKTARRGLEGVFGRTTKLTRTLLHAENEAYRQPAPILQSARTYLSATDPEVAKRPWRVLMEEWGGTKTGVTLRRHDAAMKDRAFDVIRHLPILETQGTAFPRCFGRRGCIDQCIPPTATQFRIRYELAGRLQPTCGIAAPPQTKARSPAGFSLQQR